jgi:glycine/D-amino acid oxidase-like deaminating enzyme
VLADKVICGTGAYTVGAWKSLDRSFRIQRVFVAATQPLSDNVRRSVLPADTTMHDGRGDIFVYKYDAAGRIVASMFPMGRRGRDLDHTRRLMSERLKWLHPQIEQVEWPYFWWGELDMQERTIPRLFNLAPGVVAALGFSGRGVPTGTMIGGVLADWAMGVRDADLALEPEPLCDAGFHMAFGTSLVLGWSRLRDYFEARREGAPLPPYS